MSARSVLLTAFLATLVRPTWWLIAVAGFLVRGGFVLFFLPIVAIPSVLTISNVVAPVIVPVVFGRVGEVAAFVGLTATVLAVWLLAGGWLAALTEVALVRRARVAAVAEGFVAPSLHAPGADGRWLSGRVLAVRLLAHVPLAVALAFGFVRIVDVIYRELVNPNDVITPLLLRVLANAALPLALIVVAWVAGELIGARAARRVVLGDAGLGEALAGALGEIRSRPIATVATDVVPLVALVVALVAMLVAATVAWSRLRVVLLGRTIEPSILVIALGSFVVVWLAALVLAGLVAAWRSAAASFGAIAVGTAGTVADEAEEPTDDGTFGASTHRRPGDWSVGDGGGSL